MAKSILIIETVLNFLLKPKGCNTRSIMRMAGYFFLALGGGIGCWFFFQALIPLIGYLQSGALMSALFLGVGGGFLFWGRRKKTACPMTMILGEAQEIFKGMDVEKMLKNNFYKVLLVSFIGGVILAQARDGKKLAYLKDKLPQLKDLFEALLQKIHVSKG